ncbi:N-acetylmuramoyl-L-alanine amidase [Anaerofustis sp.]|uniref:N-acetylmuramoyl-L-alanine amidase family protein n=1 Tax=Anaerofustis sp. TaxID=1872517 RepID=UPI0025BC8339|nr:N-acetylmuramoyl-L-alanine amidase [Anaerofustis sp.]
MVDVYISPSVQHFNLGVNGYGSEEERMNEIADIVEYELNRHGLVTDRNSPNMTLAQVVEDSNSVNPRVHVAIHSNAANGEARGAEIYTHRFGGEGEKLARDIYPYLEALTSTDDLGVKEGRLSFGGKGMYELRKTVAPAVLMEVGFHDNPEDSDFIINNIYEYGRDISKGILDYFGIPYNEDSGENIEYLKNKYNGKYYE